MKKIFYLDGKLGWFMLSDQIFQMIIIFLITRKREWNGNHQIFLISAIYVMNKSYKTVITEVLKMPNMSILKSTMV